jgi:hypothetical protein
MISTTIFIPIILLLSRLILILSIPLEGIRGYGDYWNFYHLASLGLPYFDCWVEFPPLFSFLSYLLYQFVGGRQHAYEYAFALMMSLIQAGNLFIFIRIASSLYDTDQVLKRGLIYFGLLVGLFYGWAYFDPLAVFFLLLGIYFFLNKRNNFSAAAFATGALIKWFPILGLIILWRRCSIKKALQLTLMIIVIIGFVYGMLFILSPEMTIASLQAQIGRGSWETIWALIDGNLNTGNFGSHIDHLDPTTVNVHTSHSSKIPSWVRIIPFTIIGSFIYLKTDQKDNRKVLSLFGLTLTTFFLWSPGWSPQWVLYLLPFILLVLPEREAFLFALVLVFLNLLEWPILLSRGYFDALKYLIPLRAFLLLALLISFWQEIRKLCNNRLNEI